MITRRDGDMVHSAANNEGSEDIRWTRGMEWALSADDEVENTDRPEDPTEIIETVEEFRTRIIENIGNIRLVILTPRKEDNYEIAPEVLDELINNPKTGDKIVFCIIKGGSLTYTRTVERNGDTISWEEKDLLMTIEEFRKLMFSKLECIFAISLAPRGTIKK